MSEFYVHGKLGSPYMPPPNAQPRDLWPTAMEEEFNGRPR